MNKSHSLQRDSWSSAGVSPETIRRLLHVVTGIADTHSTLVERRQAVLVALLDLVQADSGNWAWGRGWPLSSAVTPVSVIWHNVSEQQMIALMQWGLDPDTDVTFRPRVRAQMGDRTSATTIWQDIYTPEEWEARPSMRRHLSAGDWSSWMHAVRYTDGDTWCSLFLLRNGDRPEFGPTESAIVDMVLAGIPWLHSTAEECLPPETFDGLTARQRTVMLMLLDGMARKTISSRLGITEDTVGDHIKAIYARFGVGSSGELAALFLRGR
jgi:DNA-binding CsgD family transcriptional regulator